MYKSIKVEPELTINDGFSTTVTATEEEYQHEIFIDNNFNGRKNYHCSIANDSSKFKLTNSSIVPKLKIRTSKNDNSNNNTIIKNNDVTHVVLDDEYKCDLCLLTFSSGKLLKNHIIDHHQFDINNVLNNNNCNNNNINNNNNNYNYSNNNYNYNNVNNNYNNKVKAKMEQRFQQPLESTFSSTRTLTPSKEQYGITMEITSTYNQKIHKVDINRIISQNTRIIKKDSIERFVCTLCGYNYLSQQLLTQHIYNNHVFGKIGCEYCSNNFMSTTKLRAHLAVYCKHIKEKEYNQKPYKCDLCDKSFSRPTKLKEHRTLHTGEKLHKCNLCFEEFQLYSHLVSHRYRAHMKKLPHPCQFCSKSFTRPSLLKFHINKAHIVTEPITYNCDICTKTFFTLYSLKTHKKVHLSKPHICKTCGKAFNRAVTLKEHETLHTGEKPFKCQFCDHSFQRYSMLFDHRNVEHYKKKPITCSVCEKPFKKPHQLRDHMRIHLPSSVSVVKSVPNKR